jgi:hypothetical protein
VTNSFAQVLNRAGAAARREKSPVVMQRFAVEYDRRIVGIAVRVPGGFMFYACDDRFNEMDGRLFARARTIERHLKKVAKSRRRSRRTGRPSFA